MTSDGYGEVPPDGPGEYRASTNLVQASRGASLYELAVQQYVDAVVRGPQQSLYWMSPDAGLQMQMANSLRPPNLQELVQERYRSLLNQNAQAANRG